jgi:hypothetical protein
MGDWQQAVFPEIVPLDDATRRRRNDPSHRDARYVDFPPHRCVGTLYVRDRRPTTGAWESPFDPSLWEELGPAQGKVAVPGTKELGLKVDYETSEDLAAVASLEPEALQSISLARTRVVDESLSLLAGRPLLDINLAGTGIGDGAMVHLEGMSSLQTLDLWGTMVSNYGLGSLAGLALLRTVDLWGTLVSDAGLHHLEDLPSLSRLYVPGPRISSEGIAHIGRCRALRALDLSGAHVGDEGILLLRDLRSLEVLYLWDADITDDGLAHLSLLPALTEVDLGRNPITDEGLHHLAAIPTLERVHLWDTAVTRAGLDRFRRAMPDLYTYM